MPLYREDLQTVDCSAPGCAKPQREGPIYFRSACHFAAATWVHVRGNVLTVECAHCKRLVASFQIASREDEGKSSRDA